MRKPRSITLYGRRWFDRKWGNTYFSTVIYVNGKHVHTIEYEYGYGDQWAYAAQEWLFENGYLKGMERSPHGALTPNLRIYCEDKGIEYVYGVSDVSRKRDL